jgi:hypothetical protein
MGWNPGHKTKTADKLPPLWAKKIVMPKPGTILH